MHVLHSLALAVVLALVGHAFAQMHSELPESFELDGPILDLDVTPGGTILVTDGMAVHELRADGIQQVLEIPTPHRVVINGLASTGEFGFLAATGGADLGEGAALWRAQGSEYELVGDIEAFEIAHDPDALAGSNWKNVACEEDPAQSYTSGPQSNPYHPLVLEDGGALVADAAGNTLLSMDPGGSIDWVAVFEPPIDENGDWRVLKSAEGAPEIECYVQPVPTAVAVGPDGAIYVSELTGAPAVPGWSRVWRIEPGSRHVVCPSERCVALLTGLTSIIDISFGPDGRLYVAKLDRAGWLAPLAGNSSGGSIHRCDVTSGECQPVFESEAHIGAIAFDASGDLWTVENENVFGSAPATVRRIEVD